MASASSAMASSSKVTMRSLSSRIARTSLSVHAPLPSGLEGTRAPRRTQSSSAHSFVRYGSSVQSLRGLHTSSSASATPAASTSAAGAAETSQEASAAAATEGSPAKWTPSSRRVGLIAKKVGMTSYFLPSGERIPATVFRVTANQISAHIGFSVPATNKDGTPISAEKAKARMAYTALQVAATDSFSRRGVSRQIKGHLEKAGIENAKKIIKEFKVTRDAIVPLGTYLSAAHFVPGQHIDVRAKSRGKGFQGVMKRHGFKGLRASHGVSVSHRAHGSTGQNQDPGRVFPGKKMAGRMGGNYATAQNLEVLRIDTVRDLIVVKGGVPGPEGGHVMLSDAKKALVGKAANAWNKGILLDNKGLATGTEGAQAYLPGNVIDLPFPAGTQEMASTLPQIIDVGPKTA